MSVEIVLNTLKGQNSMAMGVVTGKLDCVIVESENVVDLTISSIKGYTILNRTIKGTEYIAPRVRTQTPLEKQFDSASSLDKFNLDEELIVIVHGQVNTEVKIIFRLV